MDSKCFLEMKCKRFPPLVSYALSSDSRPTSWYADAVSAFMGPLLSRQEWDLFAQACCRVTNGWDEADPGAQSPGHTGGDFHRQQGHFL